MHYFLLLLWLWLPTSPLAPPPLPPLQIAEQFVATTGWADMKSYLCCEAASQAKRQTLGQQIPARMRRSCELLQQGTTTAVVAVALQDSVSQKDVYLHFSKDSTGWKLGAIRSLGMTQYAPPMLSILAAMPPDEVARYNQKHPHASHAFMLGNLRLWTASDAAIAAYFNLHRADFGKILLLLYGTHHLTFPSKGHVLNASRANNDPDIRRRLEQLFITSVAQGDSGCQSCVELLIAGMVNHTVGLLYEPNAAALPVMSPRELIVLKPLGEGWYLYKTN
jgi:hypothetical protein